MRGPGIVGKITAWVFGITIVLMILTGLLLLRYESDTLEMFRDEFHKRTALDLEKLEAEETKRLEEKIRSETAILAGICGTYLFNYESARLIKSLQPYLESHHEVTAVKVLNQKGGPFVALWRHPEIDTGESLPDRLRLNDTLSVTMDVFHQDSREGEITVFYTDTLLNERLRLIRDERRNDAERFHTLLESRLYKALINMIIANLIILIIQMLLLILVLKLIVLKPLNMVSDITRKLARSDLRITIRTTRKDEIGRFSEILNRTICEFGKIVKHVKSKGKQLAHTSAHTSEKISEMALSAEEISASVQTVSETTELMSKNNSSVAAAIEEISASVTQIGDNARKGAHITNQAVEIAERAGETMFMLGDAASQIGEVTEMIKKIADKTSFLALNADIEAASAGDAGKGFAVVANEIREFSKRMTMAADDIAARIMIMQGTAEQAVKDISDISEIIHKINLSSDTVSYALDDHKKAAEEISSNSAQASVRAGEIARSMAELTKRVNDMSETAVIAAGNREGPTYTEAGAQEASVRELATMAKELLELVEKFKV